MRSQSIHLTDLFFNGSREEAVEFYRNAFGAEVETMCATKIAESPPSGMVHLSRRDPLR
jgi:uncharacterized glyoxalase superfamily protein PhnB